MIRRSALAAFICVVPVLIVCLQLAQSDETDSQSSTINDKKLFEGWGKPDVALLITGRQYGYIEPCGCTGLASQKGGLARRYTLLKQLREKGWDVVPLDAGNQVRRFGAQAAIKFHSTVDGLREMDYQAVALGPDDLRLSAGDLYAAVADPEGEGSLASDIFISANVSLFDDAVLESFRLIDTGGKKIGVASVLGTGHLKRVTQDGITTSAPMEALKSTMADMKKAGCDFQVLLSHASINESKLFAKAFPQLDLVVTTGGAGEPTRQPQKIAGTKAVMIQAGTKGMYAGVVGIFSKGEEKLRYQRVPLDARFKDSREMLDLLAAYQDKLKEQGLDNLGLNPVPHPSGRKYVGSETCGDCHSQAYEKWLTTPHHHATVAISGPNERSEIPRHFDPECISCHVTGWNPQQYIPYESGYFDLEESVAMHGNGCENCHGPGSMHVAAENGDLDDLTDELIEKHRLQMRLPLADARQKCLECHDLDNDPNFHKEGMFEEYWEQIKHPWRE